VKPDRRATVGVLSAAGAFFVWGMIPLYFRALRGVPALEIIAHRILWSVVFLALLMGVTRGFGELRATFARPRTVARLALTSALVIGNWLTFVWAVNAGRILDTSLGYFITPQVNVLLGFVFLHERLRRAQWLAVLLALAGVLNQIWLLGQLPWISLVLALTFGSYGLFRKQIAIDALTGLMVETLLAAPVALVCLVYWWRAGTLSFGHHGRSSDALLAGLGVVTAIPLMLFAAGARRLRLATVGFLQYLAPSMTFVLAVVVYGEQLGTGRALTFALIWAGIVVYAVDSISGQRRAPLPQ
jgi:chloramphenicol-sensitive protein RarD